MKKCVLFFLLFVFVLAIASIMENRETKAEQTENSQQELALQESSSHSVITP